ERRDPLAPRHRVRQRVHGQCRRPAASTATRPAPFFGLPVALQRVADVLSGLTQASTGRGQRTTLAVVENPPHRRTIPEHTLSPLVRYGRLPSRGSPCRLPGASPSGAWQK